MQTCFFCIFLKFIFFLVLLLFVFPYLTFINTLCFMNFLKRGTVLQIFHENPRVDVKILNTTSESWMQIYTYFEAENFVCFILSAFALPCLFYNKRRPQKEIYHPQLLCCETWHPGHCKLQQILNIHTVPEPGNYHLLMLSSFRLVVKLNE